MEEEWFNAARSGDDKRVAELLAEQPNLIEAKDRTRNTALHCAAEAGHETIVARLLGARPVSLYVKNSRLWTALDLAASNGHDKVVAQMLATADVVGFDISKSLSEAVRQNRPKVVDLLLSARSPNFILPVNGDAVLALYCAIIEGDEKAFTRILEICPSMIDVDEFGSSALHQAAGHGCDNMMSQILALRPQKIDGIDRNGLNALMYAADGGHPTTAETLLAIRPEQIFHVSKEGNTVLHHAVVGSEDAEFVGKLWRLNPQALTHANVHSETPFQRAVEFSRDELIGLFQWSLSFDDIVSAFTHHQVDYQERYRPVMERLCESLFVSLTRDVAGTVLEYVGIDIVKCANKRTKLS